MKLIMFPYIAAKQDCTKGHSCPLSELLGLGLACISERAIRHESHLSPVSQSSFKNSTRRKKRTSFKRRTSKKGTDVSSHYVSQCADISVSAGHGHVPYVKKGKFLFPLKLEVGHTRLMRLVPVKIYLFFLYVSLPLTPTLRHLFKQLTATVCACVRVYVEVCVFCI